MLIEDTNLSAPVLIVEDDEDLRFILKLMVEHQFASPVIDAANAEVAIELVSQKMPSLILMDLVLPKMGGLEAVGVIKANPATKDIPVIVISDHCWNVEIRERTHEFGALHCVDKAHLLEQLPPLLGGILTKMGG